MEGLIVISERQKTILIVEDEAILALAEAQSIEKFGFKAITVFNGEKAVNKVEQSPDIDLILMDIDLGKGMDGTQAAEKILEKHNLPLIFLSSHTEREVVEKTEHISSYGYIVKNSGETVLIASIKMAFRLFEARRKEIAMERAMKVSDDKFYKIFQATPNSITVVKMPEGRFVEVNRSFERISGYCFDEVVGKTSLDINIWKNLADRKRVSTKLMEEGYFQEERLEFVKKSGDTFIAAATFVIIDIKGVDYSIAILTDITRYIQTEKELQEFRGVV